MHSLLATTMIVYFTVFGSEGLLYLQCCIDKLNLPLWYRSNTLESACEASEMLLQVVVRKVAERDEQYLNVLKVALSFALYSLDCFKEHVVSSEQEIVKYFVEERLDKVTTELSKWISRIWSVSFGTPRNGAFNPEHARKEIKVG